MRQCNLYEAKTHLSQLVQAALDGEDVYIARAGKPAVRLVPVGEGLPRTGGLGSLAISPDALDAAFSLEAEAKAASLIVRGSDI